MKLYKTQNKIQTSVVVACCTHHSYEDFLKETGKKLYSHIETAAIDTKEGWTDSYNSEELETRNLTAEEAFDEDEGVTLLEVK